MPNIFYYFDITFKIGKSDPNNRIFIKTFHQLTNHYFITNNIPETQKDEDKKKEIIKKISLFFQKTILVITSLHLNYLKKIQYLVGPKGLDIIAEK